MNPPRGPHAAAYYELRVAGHLDEHWSAWFHGLTPTREDNGTTILRGPVADHAELHGLLAKVRHLGTPLLSVNTTDPSAGPPTHPQAGTGWQVLPPAIDRSCRTPVP